MSREQPYGENCSGQKIEDRDATPHQRACALLVRQRGDPEWPRCVQVDRVDDSIAKGEIGGKNVARERGKEKVEEDEPARLRCDTRPGLNYWPPKK